MCDDRDALDALDDAGLELCLEEVEHSLRFQLDIIGDEQYSSAASGDEFSYSHMGGSSPCEMAMPSALAQPR